MIFLPSEEPPKIEAAEGQTSKNLLMGFAVLCICMMLGGVAYRGVTVVLPSYFELKNQALFEGLSRFPWLPTSKNVAATALTSLVFVVGILGQYLGGYVAERFETRRSYLIFHTLALPLALLMAYTTDLPLLLVTSTYMLFLLGMQPIENTLVAYLTPDRLRHSGYGTKFILTFGVGAVSVHMVGWVQQVWSLSAVFVTMALVSSGIVLSTVLLIHVTGKLGFKG
jgi:MFS family permease